MVESDTSKNLETSLMVNAFSGNKGDSLTPSSATNSSVFFKTLFSNFFSSKSKAAGTSAGLGQLGPKTALEDGQA